MQTEGGLVSADSASPAIYMYGIHLISAAPDELDVLVADENTDTTVTNMTDLFSTAHLHVVLVLAKVWDPLQAQHQQARL